MSLRQRKKPDQADTSTDGSRGTWMARDNGGNWDEADTLSAS